jgi:hypothetical protein
MSDLLKIDAILVCIGCGIAVGYVDRNVVIVAVGKVDVITVTAAGIWCGCCSRVNFVVTVGVIDFDTNICVAQAIVKISINPAAPTKCVTKPEPVLITTFEAETLVALRTAIQTKIMRPRQRKLDAQ